jgi:hypothetical protein
MKYEKPALDLISNAMRLIESVDRKMASPLVDHINHTFNNTGPAYEADE